MERRNQSVAIEVSRERWLRLVQQYRSARRDAQQHGAPTVFLEKLDFSYNVQIDLAYLELKSAESLDKLRSVL